MVEYWSSNVAQQLNYFRRYSLVIDLAIRLVL